MTALQSFTTQEGARNVRAGLVLLPLGVFSGLALSLFAFVPIVPPPPGFESYADLPRRMVRLAHIAAVMLPLINVVLGRWIDVLALSPIWRRRASWLLLVGAIGLPAFLVAEALVHPLAVLHVSGIPALSLTAALTICGVGAARTPTSDFARRASST